MKLHYCSDFWFLLFVTRSRPWSSQFHNFIELLMQSTFKENAFSNEDRCKVKVSGSDVTLESLLFSFGKLKI
ncbi:hypothetical protein RB195_013306 [Necator americanus]|uniref:Uncharacterized protein n=1 Tax=Necator americanus TaxID=51031 RepID=A0ABR1DUW4_NECAM